MIKRIVVFRPKEGTTQEQIDEIFKGLSTFPEKIPYVKNFSIGKNLMTNHNHYTHGFCMEFDSLADHDRYMADEWHLATSRRVWAGVVEDWQHVVYEF